MDYNTKSRSPSKTNLKKIASFAKNKSPEEFKAIISQIKIDGNNTPSTAEVDRIYENIIDLL